MGKTRRQRAITGRSLVAALVIGAMVSLVFHIVDPAQFRWWFVLGGSVGTVFAYAAFLRRDRWEERNACLAMGGICIAASLVGDSLFFLVGVFVILGLYQLTLKWAAERDRGETDPSP